MFKTIMFLIFSITTVLSHAKEDKYSWGMETEIAEIVSNGYVNVKDGKFYIDLENIVLSRDGMYVDFHEHGMLPIDSLCNDSMGYYFLSYDRAVTKKCPFCDHYRVSYAIKCSNPECPSNKNKKTQDDPQKEQPKKKPIKK